MYRLPNFAETRSMVLRHGDVQATFSHLLKFVDEEPVLFNVIELTNNIRPHR